MYNYLVPPGLAHGSWDSTKPVVFYYSTPRDKWHLDNGHCLWIKNETHAVWSYVGGEDLHNTGGPSIFENEDIVMHDVKALFRMDASKHIIYIEDVYVERYMAGNVRPIYKGGKRVLRKLCLDLLLEGIRIFYGDDWFFRFWYPHDWVKQKLTESDKENVDKKKWRITERIAKPRPSWYLDSTSIICSC